MASLRLSCEWLDAPTPDAAFGPERTTWGQLTIEVNETCVTENVPSDGERVSRRSVTGPMSGLADWLVENWASVLWDVRTPFPKVFGDASARVPTLQQLREGSVTEANIADLAKWLHRHTLGHGSSDLALPSLVLLPEDRVIGIAVAPPDYHLSPTVRFNHESPPEPVWIPKDEIVGTCAAFVEEVIGRAERSQDGKRWASWLRDRFKVAQDEASKPAVQRRMMFGTLVASRWEQVSAKLGSAASALFGVLLDAETVRETAVLNDLSEVVAKALKNGKPTSRTWTSIRSESGELRLPPYERGYRLAQRARAALKDPEGPLTDLPEVLASVGVSLAPFEHPDVFRSAAVATRSGPATVFVARKHAQGVAPSRFAVAAALGRLLAEGHTAGDAFGAAQGGQSRWIPSQVANAFAAEFLVPIQALRQHADDTHLCEKYGMSRVAVERHRSNRLRTQ